MKEKSRILKKVDEDQSRPVSFNDSFGGGDNQLRFLLKYLPDESFKDINLILNSTNHDLIEKDKINVLWVHHFVNQKEIQNLGYRVDGFMIDKDIRPSIFFEKSKEHYAVLVKVFYGPDNDDRYKKIHDFKDIMKEIESKEQLFRKHLIHPKIKEIRSVII